MVVALPAAAGGWHVYSCACTVRCALMSPCRLQEFSGEDSRAHWVLQHSNLVVLRTFSKSAGLAGLRVGYGAFPAGLVEYMWRAKQPYNVSVAAETAACAALSNPAYLQASAFIHLIDLLLAG